MEKSHRENENDKCCKKISRKTKIFIIIFASFLLFIVLIIPLVLLSIHSVSAAEVKF